MCSLASCQLFPQLIALGGSADLIVSLTEPAPPGGVTVTLKINSNGAEATLLSIPSRIDFAHGQQTLTFSVLTRKVDKPATRIVFSARLGTGGSFRSAELDIFS